MEEEEESDEVEEEVEEKAGEVCTESPMDLSVPGE